ncbi:MAG: ATP-binding protein [Nostoc sp.]|uniref:pPIWI_RE_Z domain-containing protein n=1 Tax=Nostoc sp. TaxID=1180 RepID=UPI002FF83D8F
MRDSSTLNEALKKVMGGESPPIEMKFSDFARTELMLHALWTHFPDQAIRKAHLLMQGYREPGTTDAQWDILKHLRHLAPEFRSSISWEIALRSYDDVAKSSASGWLGFDIDYPSNKITPTKKMALARYDLYERLLTQEPLKFRQTKYRPAPAGDYEFNINPQQTRTIRISKEIANIGVKYATQIPSINLSKDRQSIKIPLADLIKKGTELKPILGYDAGQILNQSTYWDIQQDQEAREIFIDGEGHILGPTGSGKSTLIDCLVALLVDSNKRVAIATNSVGEVQNWLEFAQKVGIRAVPIIGESERHKHLSRLNQAVMFSNKQQPFTHPGFKWLSQSCPLYSLAQPQIPQTSSGQRSRPPCFGKLQDVNDPNKVYSCPLAPICPRHIKANTLENAQLIVGTLQGFIQKKVAPHNLTENITILEYLALTTDLLIIDEVDLAQPKLDEIFYPTETLASFDLLQDTWTRTESYQHVHGLMEGEVVVPGRYRDPYLEQSEDQRHLANRGIGALMYLMRNITNTIKGKSSRQEIENLLKAYTQEGRLFTAWTFFDKLAEQLSGLAHVQSSANKIRKQTLSKYQRNYDRYREIFKRIQNNPVSPDTIGLNSSDTVVAERLALVSGALLAGDLLTTVPHPNCKKFIQTTRWDIKFEQLESDVERFIDNLAKLLQLAIYAAHVLGALGKHVSARGYASVDLESTLPMTPPSDFESLLPNSPVGSVTSAQFLNRQLRIFRGIALGRSLLSQWNSIFSIDGLTPANLLVTSATSYSGNTEQSYPFHVQLKPTLLIEPPPEKSKAVAHDSEFFYCPVVDDAGNPVFISGSQGDDRQENISRMIAGLCRKSKQGKPLLEQFQDYLAANVGSDRKNLLIVTNSYAEAKAFYNSLKNPYLDRASYVVQDGRWVSDDQVSRSKLTEFPGRGKEFLIAPMGAISRAINMMHPLTGEPYFGGMVIAVRQHPSPDDNQTVISGVNKETIDIIDKLAVEVIQRHARHARDTFLTIPQIFSRLPDKIAKIALKTPLIWTLTVNLTQLIGRSTRGGRKTVVWFVDAAFMPETAKGNSSGDSEQNSILLAARKLLGSAINKGGASGRLIKTLYGPVYYPLTRLTHFIHGVKL